MTAHDPRVTLTEAEAERLHEAQAIIRGDAMREGATVAEAHAAAYNAVVRPVERIIDARLAPIRAVLDACDETKTATVMISAVRAALSAHESAPQHHEGTGSQSDDERAGEP